VSTNDADEFALLATARRSDPDEFGTLFDLHRDRVFRHALRLTRSLHDAEDITGIVFLEAWRRRESMREVDGSVIGWLLVTTNNVHRNFSRASRRYQHILSVLPMPENSPDPTNTVDDRLDSDARRAGLRRALAQLPRRDVDVLSLCVIEELSTAVAAAVLGVAPGTVKSRLSRAKSRLVALLDDTIQLASLEGDPR